MIEETPVPGPSEAVTGLMTAAAVRAAREIGYVGAGTLEFLLGPDGRFFFMEANCRIQVEHPVTEAVTGVDLVREQLMVASGARLTLRQEDVFPRGAAIECRVNAEDPDSGFLPTPGVVEAFLPPSGPFTRVDTDGRSGMTVTAHYDPLLAKLIVWAPDRGQAIARMDRALGDFVVESGQVRTTIGFLREVLAHPVFRDAEHTTSLAETMLARRR